MTENILIRMKEKWQVKSSTICKHAYCLQNQKLDVYWNSSDVVIEGQIQST